MFPKDFFLSVYNLLSNKCRILSQLDLCRITLKQPGWALILRCSMEILASLPTSFPQYVQTDDSEPLEMQSDGD